MPYTLPHITGPDMPYTLPHITGPGKPITLPSGGSLPNVSFPEFSLLTDSLRRFKLPDYLVGKLVFQDPSSIEGYPATVKPISPASNDYLKAVKRAAEMTNRVADGLAGLVVPQEVKPLLTTMSKAGISAAEAALEAINGFPSQFRSLANTMKKLLKSTKRMLEALQRVNGVERLSEDQIAELNQFLTDAGMLLSPANLFAPNTLTGRAESIRDAAYKRLGSSGLSTGAIVGITAGSIVGAVVVIGGIVLCVRKTRSEEEAVFVAAQPTETQA
ncbi:MAG: hypothetical protein KVP17_000834 [Porospora cf. gigantea B]|uniref:uncharacterized protein n=1 Tax=Porospora cf. gigantea B TaxID=2853592 RepID=UPI0035719DA9|nr:MAG: hypothetical protein KVP17_000834 [Porospora cf. gigantea B]